MCLRRFNGNWWNFVTNMNDSRIFFIKFLPAQQFCHAILKINDKSTKLPQNQILKCRQFLFLCRDVMACPNVFDASLLDVVMSMAFFREKKIRPFCQKLGLQPVHASPAMLNVFQECFSYTLRFRMSQSWNLIGCYLVKGPDVVNCNEKQEAVDLDIVVSDEQITLSVRALAIRNPPPSLNQFDICYQALQNFRVDPDGTIEKFSIYGSWCHILPSMKRGQLVRVTHKIPTKNQGGSPPSFTDYTGLKKYWKIQHGIRLPESEEGMLYGSIFFKLIGEQLFTYPLCCLRTRGIQVMPRCDAPAIIKDFIDCLHQKMPQICGLKLTYSSRACYITNSLSEATQIKTSKLQNVTMDPGIRKLPPVPPRPPNITAEVPQFSQNSRKDVILPSQADNTTKEKIENCPSSQIIPSSQVVKEKANDIIGKVLKSFPVNADGKYIPVFATKKSKLLLKSTNQCGKKIEIDLTKKKKPCGAVWFGKSNSLKKLESPPGFSKKNGLNEKMSNHSVKAGAGKIYKTPSQFNTSLNDSGYSSNETPTLPDRGESQGIKKYQPKKLSFDHILNSTSKESKSRKWTFNQQRSPLKIIKNHAFDTLFSKAAENPETAGKSSTKNTLGKDDSPLKIIKNHSFDKLFSKAGNVNEENSTLASLPSGVGFSSDSPLKIRKTHAFDSLFKSATSIENDEGVKRNADNSSNSFSKYFSTSTQEAINVRGHKEQKDCVRSGNHSFDKLFASAGTIRSSPHHEGSTTPLAVIPKFTKTKRSFEEVYKSAKAQVLKDQTFKNICSAGNSNGVVLSQTACLGHTGPHAIAASAACSGIETPTSKSTKKRLGTGSATRQPKKPRNSLSVEELARSDMLKKANAPSLSSWLKSNGVGVTSRDKKDDLVAKVKLQIMLKGGNYRGVDD